MRPIRFSPRPTLRNDNSLATPSTAEYKYADPFPTCSHKYILPRIQTLLSPLGPGSRILDLGCGNGSLIGAVRRSAWEMHGVDASVSGIEMARLEHPHVQFWTGDVTRLSRSSRMSASVFRRGDKHRSHRTCLCASEVGVECFGSAPSRRQTDSYNTLSRLPKESCSGHFSAF